MKVSGRSWLIAKEIGRINESMSRGNNKGNLGVDIPLGAAAVLAKLIFETN